MTQGESWFNRNVYPFGANQSSKVLSCQRGQDKRSTPRDVCTIRRASQLMQSKSRELTRAKHLTVDRRDARREKRGGRIPRFRGWKEVGKRLNPRPSQTESMTNPERRKSAPINATDKHRPREDARTDQLVVCLRFHVVGDVGRRLIRAICSDLVAAFRVNGPVAVSGGPVWYTRGHERTTSAAAVIERLRARLYFDSTLSP